MMTSRFWTSLQSWAAIAVQLAILVLLSRILTPADFGYYAINLSVIHVLMLFGELGSGQFVVKEGTKNRAFLRSRLGLVLLMSLGVICGAIALCVLVAWRFPKLEIDVALFCTLSFIIVLFSIKSISFSALQRDGHHHKTAIAELVALGANILVAYVLALYLKTYWALAIGYVTYHFVGAVLCAAYYPVRPQFKNMITKDATHFTRSYVFLRMLDMATRTFDNIILAFSTSTHNIGLYQRATNMRNLGHTFSHTPNHLMYYPRLSDAASHPARLKQTFIKLLQSMLFYAIPISILGFCLAPAWTGIVFGPGWNNAAPLIQILAISIPFRALEGALEMLSKAKGRQDEIIKHRVVFAALYMVAIYAGSLVSLEMVATFATCVFITSSLYSLILSARMCGVGTITIARFVAPYLGYYVVLLLICHVSIAQLNNVIPLAAAGIVSGFGAIALFFVPVVVRGNQRRTNRGNIDRKQG